MVTTGTSLEPETGSLIQPKGTKQQMEKSALADAYDTIGGGRPWPGRCEDMVREKVKTPATVSQAETAADQHMCSGVIPMCHPDSGFG